MFFFLISPSPGVSERASLFSSSSRFWHSSIFYFLFEHHRYFLESDIWDGYIFHVSLLYLNFSFCISLILEIPRGVDIFEFVFFHLSYIDMVFASNPIHVTFFTFWGENILKFQFPVPFLCFQSLRCLQKYIVVAICNENYMRSDDRWNLFGWNIYFGDI